ncbi:hypothetical protein GIB67_008801 [Kingdonia uniflora]|uniref:Aminotransferase-like plant mobile domain-containing protein n=1 Tax=Kingdonia uniflora TaxID=39325 RepID=A0A7J7MHW0_9MAGN|nr:hypothetical protein GIB67_008801 [Kingdonia uniflora]
MNEGIETENEPQIEQFGNADFNDESSPQRNDLGVGSAEDFLGAQPTEGELMNEENVKAPPMADPPQTEVSQKETASPIDDTCLRVHHHAPAWHLEKEPTIVRDLVMFVSLDMISEISYEHYNAGLISAICEHWQPDTNTFHFSCGKMTLSLYDVQHLIGLSADGDVPITKGSWSLPKLVEIFKKNLYQDEDFFNSMKTKGQGNSLSLVKLVNFYAGKLEKINDSIQNERPAGQKKKTMLALFVACTYMLYVLGTFLLPVRKGSYVTARDSFDNYKVEDVVGEPYRAERRSDHDFNENTFFNGLTSSPDHVEPIYPNRVVRQFARIQPIPKNPKYAEVSGLRTWDGEEKKKFKHKYEWVDVFSKGLWKEWISVSWTKICPPTVDLSANDAIGLSTCHPIGRVQSKPDNCDVPMEVSRELPNVCEHEKYLMLRDENKALVEQISVLKEEVQKMKDQKKFEEMKEDRILNDVVHEQYVKSFKKLPAKLEEKLAVIPKGEPVPSRDLQKKIVELTVKYEDVVKRLKEKESFIITSNYRWVAKCKSDTVIHDKKIETLEAWRQAMKKEFHSGELAEKDDPTFIELFDQYNRFYTNTTRAQRQQYARLFTRYGAPMPPVSTLWLAHVDLGLRGDFQRDMVQKWFGVTIKLFKALLKENNVKGYKLKDLI